jgi:hypothetical protein
MPDNHTQSSKKRVCSALKTVDHFNPEGAAMNGTMVLYGGLDLHGDNVFCTLMDTSRKVVFEQRLPNDIVTIKRKGTGY